MPVKVDKWINSDRRNYRLKKQRITAALKGSTGIIDGVTDKNKEDIFYMLLFCLCVPQSKAIKAEEAIHILRDHNYYTKDIPHKEMLEILKGRVRFHTTKSNRLKNAKINFQGEFFWKDLKYQYQQYKQCQDDMGKQQILERTRRWLIKNIDGMGMKLASHFLRNIGMPGLAILDVHVIKGMQKRGLITETDVTPLSTTKYESVSQVMKKYAQQVGISIDELDMLLWSQQTGYVFK